LQRELYMSKPKLTGSASLPLSLSAFGALHVLLAASFPPFAAFVLALLAAYVLAKL
jgi:hypothetical protein